MAAQLARRTDSTETAVVEGIGRMGGGILLDATLIRGVLAPAAVAILGRWNWWLPHRPARLLRVEPSGVTPEVETAPQPA